jgi:hypothetical protein
MVTASDSLPHIIRTAKDPRQDGLYSVTISKIDEVNSSVRLIQLALPNAGVGHPANASTPCQVLFNTMEQVLVIEAHTQSLNFQPFNMSCDFCYGG